MDKKAINEVKKCFNKNDCRIDRMRACYVNEEGEKLETLHDTFLALQDEEMAKYCELFRRALSGKLGRNLFNVAFPLAEEQTGGHQEFLYRLRESALKDDALVQEFFDHVIESAELSGKYLIVLVHGIYDIPKKTTDGLTMEDASEEVYRFLLCLICPVTLLREGLCYDRAAGTFLSRTDDWAVQKPDAAFLFPSFNERSTDLHETLFYAKNPKERHEELARGILGTELPRAETEQQNVFRDLIETTLDRDCDFEAVKNISDSLQQMIRDAAESESPAAVGKPELRRLLAENGAGEEQLRKFEAIYEEAMGEDSSPLLAENVTDSRSLVVKSDNVKLNVKAEASDIVETRILDGREYLLIPVSDNIEVNGIRIRTRSAEES